MSKPVRILVVDDEPALMQALRDTLAQQGYDTTGRCSAADALALLQGQCFELMLTDLMMPVTDGLALARAALEIDPQMVVVMMTGQGSVATAVEAMQSGVLDYVLKPFKLGSMLPVLRRALAVRELRAQNVLLQQRVQQRTLALENANRELEAYAAAVSHDLRAPLRSVDGLTQLLAQKLAATLTPETQALLDLIGQCTRRGQSLVEDLLRLSHVSRQPLQRSDVDVGHMVREVAAELRTASPEFASVTLEVAGELPNGLPADAGLLRQVFVNLLGNALKFAHRTPGARVQVGVLDKEGEDPPVFCVADNGPGFDMAQADRLFMPFERLQGALEFEGSGVGLSIAQRIVQRHGGRIWAESAPGQGARFHFTLSPAAETLPPDVAAT